ncbi:SusC/RagA family TonB-linked outer membrane protein [Chitinophaga sp. ysch24]|uniref:SusC/RagA family TonB-linked outer membrane protein n=2 Tax=Chitinophaga tropicalis TaxID=2683588 RepID=A0A7K1U338_9BACT|nr:SusC/RagA family TonB-linked outer membrane protein [Chitinophaga tropicalis]
MRSALALMAAALSISFCCFPALAQNSRTVQGTVLDAQNMPVAGASVKIKQGGNGAQTSNDGKFSLLLPAGKQVLEISHVGKTTREVEVGIQDNNIIITLKDAVAVLEDVIIVGYGRQKKASVVGAITQTSGKVLERTGGVTNLGMALTGNLPGVITSASTGMPGAEDPQILIRAQSSWNNSAPLILVDGIERSMSTIDISSVESISVLKDASATAVYGVKGANGVILITTKKGTTGKAVIQIRSNMTTKVASKLPEKYDSYDAFVIKNLAIQRELMLSANGWSAYKPQQIIDKYRNPLNAEDWDRYPNVDWTKELFKDRAMSYSTAVNVSGGSQFVTYFAGADFVYEGDLFKTFQNGRGYKSGYGYNRINVRSNLDFNLTKTTRFSTKLFGSNGVRKVPWGAADNDQGYWASAYRTSPDAMRPIYSDGTWGFFQPRNADVPNSVYNLAMSGIEKRTNTQLTTDFILQQQLDMITRGLSVRGSISLDNTFRETQRGINDAFNYAQRKWVDPETGTVFLEYPINSGTQLDYSDGIRWSGQPGSVDRDATYRRQNYMFQLNYDRRFGKHDVTAMGLLQREKVATGSQFARYREDWVFRATYNYDTRYFFETNGAYNGSEQFGPDYRFAFFPSFSAGWMLSNENLMSSLNFLDVLKIRASWGKIGDDAVAVGRWPFRDQWAFGGNAQMGSPPANTPYTFYRVSSLGNPNISWEKVEKRNLGIDYSFLQGKIAGSVDVFSDNRTDIIINGASRAIPSYFGVSAPSANLGRVTSKGYEIELRLDHTFKNGIHIWANTNMTHATNKTIFRDDPELRLAYQKQAGYSIGQTRTYLDYGYLQSWDDIYGSTQRSTNNQNKLPGDYNIIDFNGDGIIDGNDTAPYGYAGTPQNTYNASLGIDWRGLSLFLQFYGVNNVTREVTFPTFHSSSNVAYVEGAYWLKQNGGGDVPLPRWSNLEGGGGNGTRYLFDGSYTRLKNAEIGYTLSGGVVKKMGIKTCKIYVNGNNLLLWTKMPDDRESNFSGGSSLGAYPTVRRFNLGIDITL